MDNNRWTILETVLLILADLVILTALVCILWASLDRLGWVRFVMSLPPLPGKLKMILWGWW